METDNIKKAFDAFVDEKYADSEETLRTELRQAVNDFLKGKLDLTADPIQTAATDDDSDDNKDDDSDDDNNEE